jgi:HD-GYP domain-containing protein (c-di-GMP phosphodiesterase class II)/DNA-binding CsgD family transcriptional regulator
MVPGTVGGVVMSESVPDRDTVRAAEIVASLCLATDLGMGFPFEHGFHATLMAMRLADLLEVDPSTRRDTYYSCLMVYAGCTTDAYEGTTIFAGSATEDFIPHLFGSRAEQAIGAIRAMPPPEANALRRAYETAKRIPRALAGNVPHQRSLCEVAEIMADRLGMPSEFAEMFYFFTERWDGRGLLGRARGDEIPMPLRISMVARDIAFQRVIGGDERALAIIRNRGGLAFDPNVVGTFASNASEVFRAGEPSESTWELVLDAEPKPHVVLDEAGIDRALSAIADFSDLLAPSLTGHSSGVANLAGRAAELAGLGPEEVKTLHRASLVHDIGRVAVTPRIWEKPGRLTADEMEQVRLHPYQSERVLRRSPFLADLAALASCHHERLDGSGYHRGLTAQSMSPGSRLIAAADSFHALTEPRAHRGAHGADAAAETVVDLANSGVLDPLMVRAVVEAAGEPTPNVEMPAGLTEREMEVLTFLARGLQTKQIARHFDLSRKTVDTHIQAAYRKMGVSTRAAATLFAMEHGLIRSGEFPMVSRSTTS